MTIGILKKTGVALALGVALSATSWFGTAQAGPEDVIAVCLPDKTGAWRVAAIDVSAPSGLGVTINVGDGCAGAVSKLRGEGFGVSPHTVSVDTIKGSPGDPQSDPDQVLQRLSGVGLVLHAARTVLEE